MVNKALDFKGIPVYEDVYMESHRAIRSYKYEDGVKVISFVVASTNVITLLKQHIRNKTLDEILNMI